MNTAIASTCAAAALWLASCAPSQKAVIPFSNKVAVEDTYTIIWNGTSEAYRYVEGRWKRAAAYDYQFDVIQKRYATTWKSVKSLHRLHPDYDGKAGDRDQVMYFEVAYQTAAKQDVASAIQSSLGNGTGTTDREFRQAELTIAVKDGGPFLPYNKIRIRQVYHYEQGLLTETVELLKEKDGKDTPFMKNEEKAYFYLRGRLDKAPTTFGN